MANDSVPAFSTYSDLANDILADGLDFGRIKVNFDYKGFGEKFSVHSGCSVATDSTGASTCFELKQPAVDIGGGHSFSYSQGYNSEENARSRTFALETAQYRSMRVKAQLSTREKFAVDSFSVEGSARNSKFHSTAGVDVEMGRQCKAFLGSTSFDVGPCLVGGQVAYDSSSGTFTDVQIGCSYSEDDFTAVGTVHRGADFRGYRVSLFQKVSEKLQCATQMTYSSGSCATGLTLAGRYTFGTQSFGKIKFNNQSDLAVSYERELEPGVKLTVGALFGVQSLFRPSLQRYGVGLSFEACKTPDIFLSLLKG